MASHVGTVSHHAGFQQFLSLRGDFISLAADYIAYLKVRCMLMKAYGAQLVLTDGKNGMAGAIEKAKELTKEIPGSWIPGQFENLANPFAHYKTTAPEIWRALGETDIFVAGVGTGGTLTGVGWYLKEKNPSVWLVAVEPLQSPLLSKGYAGQHGIQGIGANFIPPILDKAQINEVLTVDDREAVEMAKRLQIIEDICVGISSGANVLGAVTLAKRKENAHKKIVTVLPDEGGRYLSIYRNIL
jgi:cysteine synthase A